MARKSVKAYEGSRVAILLEVEVLCTQVRSLASLSSRHPD